MGKARWLAGFFIAFVVITSAWVTISMLSLAVSKPGTPVRCVVIPVVSVLVLAGVGLVARRLVAVTREAFDWEEVFGASLVAGLAGVACVAVWRAVGFLRAFTVW